MTLKTYNQNCGLAVALDILGDRWTLLIIRSLLLGPGRFGEIQAQLPGIGTNLLTDRLKSLVRRGVIEKEQGQQGGYLLTRKGESLRPMVCQLAHWGRDFLPLPGGRHHPQWSMFNFEAAFRPERAEGLDAVIEFTIAGETFHLTIRRQRCRAIAGAAVAPDVKIRSDGPQLWGRGARLQIHGDSDAFDRVRPCFEL
jgi:DNA-binding HxlR family transcriptional regulator